MDIETENNLCPVAKALFELVRKQQLKAEFRILTDQSSTVRAYVTLNMWPISLKGFRVVNKLYTDNQFKLLPPSLPYTDKKN